MVRSAGIYRLLFLVFLLPMTAAAQDAATSPARNASAQTRRARARIGVALEGGGALGLAHVGVQTITFPLITLLAPAWVA